MNRNNKLLKIIGFLLPQILLLLTNRTVEGTAHSNGDTRIEFRVREEQESGTEIGRIPIRQNFRYRFNEAPDEFELDSNTGLLRTKIRLDRERLPIDYFDLVVLSSQPTYPIEIRIEIEDVNDNRPQFPERLVQMRIAENIQLRRQLLLDTAVDADKGENGLTDRYTIVSGNENGHFSLVTTKSHDSAIFYLHLQIEKSLDRELQSTFLLNISATDNSITEPLTGYQQVNITVVDVNDNSPVFQPNVYNVSVSETVTIGTSIVKVRAIDRDEGANAKIAYFLLDEVDDDVLGGSEKSARKQSDRLSSSQFEIDRDTGLVTAAVPQLSCPKQEWCALQKNCAKSCMVTVLARDYGEPSRDSRCFVHINLIDANNHDPIISFRYLPLNAKFATVDENSPNNSVVAIISVTDADQSLNGETEVSITAGNDLNHFRLELAKSFSVLRVNRPLDREKIAMYNLTVEARDKGSPARQSVRYLIVWVNDINDHDPVFTKSEYSASLFESSPRGSFVASLTALDDDTGINAEIHYSIVSGDNNDWFEIDEQTGLVVTNGRLDRELQGVVELKIQARDNGPNPRYTFTMLLVSILDVNDEKPRFLNSFINVNVSENIKVPSVLTVVSATDRDQGTNGSIVYRLHSKTSMEYGAWFSLDSQSGHLNLMRSLDYEHQTEYELKIVAEDQGVPWTQSEMCTVRVAVTDVNDNRPRFEAHSKFVLVDEEAVKTVFHVTAVDRDGPLNSRVTYRLENAEHSSFVDLIKATGEIRLRKPLDKTFVNLKILAEDQNGLAAETPLDLILLRHVTYKPIMFANDNYPPIELNLKGTELVKIQTTNGDKDNQFFLTTFDNIFQINSQTGVLSLRSDITTQQITESNYTVHVAVWNQAQNLYGNTHIKITNTKGLINNFRPKFMISNDDSLVLKIREDTAIGEEVFVVKAFDEDFGPSGLVSYSLLNNHELFTIGEKSGILYVRKKLSGLSIFSNGDGSGQSGRFTLQVQAKDQSSSSGTVIEYSIEIIDVNDHTPSLNGSTAWILEISVMESIAVNERFYRLEIVDEDNGINGELDYAIDLDDETHDDFGIFPDGFLYVKRLLDRETKDFYTIRVLVSDRGNEEQRFSQGMVLISVLDENDNRPQFSNQTYSFEVGENELQGIIVGQVEATDADRGRNAELFYFMANSADTLDGRYDEGANSFEVDRRTGIIRTTKTFDRESSRDETLFVFEVWVTDNAEWGKQLQDKCKVYVQIRDVNDNPPVFLRVPYRTQMSESSIPGAHVIKLFAIDRDEGSNSYVFYRIVDGNENDSFTIDEGTGQITVQNRLDRESVPFYKLLVEAYDLPISPKKSLRTLTEVEIKVLDENDNRPEIEMNPTEVHVYENLELRSVLAEFKATDKDYGQNGQLEFNIIAGNRRETFSLDAETGVLRLKKALDFEDIRSFQLTVMVSDHGEPRLSSSTFFVVNVADVNDNRPQFSHTAIVRRLTESSGTSTSDAIVNVPIMTVLAEDADSGSNGQVEYRMKESTDENGYAGGNKYFRIDPKSGVIYRIAEIDREQIESFRLTIVATDLAVNRSERLEAEKTVTIVIDDVNDNRPVFVTGDVIVHEGWLGDGDSGNFVRVEATDADAYTNGLVTYDLIDHNAWFSVNRTSGWLRLLKRDATGTSRIQLTVRATDEAAQNERKSTDLYLTLFIFDNDNGTNDNLIDNNLEFLSRQQAVTVFEAEPADTEVAQVALAAFNNSLIVDVRFYLTNIFGSSQEAAIKTENTIDEVSKIWLNDSGPAFTVDATNGRIRTARSLDRERDPDRFILEIFAIGSAHGQLVRAKCSVEIEVLDKNDSPPKFDQKSLEINVSEDAIIGQEIGVLKATDLDDVGILTYKLMNDTLHLFELNSGAIILAKNLDRERFSHYFVQVQANDGVQFTNAILHVQIIDSNDNAPQFTKDIYSFDIDEDSMRGKVIGKIAAIDKDMDTNAQLSFSIISDWYTDVLDLSRDTGILTLKAHLDYETNEHYIFLVQAEDNGQPSLSSTATLYLNVLDMNDNSPIFDSLTYAVEVFENISINTPIVTITATDQDSDENGRIDYSISSGNENGTFLIDKQNGTIKLALSNQLDREKISTYDLIVTATDCASEITTRRSANVQVFITVKDVNDVAPEFISDRLITVDENLAPNSLVTIVKAIDRDENRNGYIEYTLLEENGQSLLTAALGSELEATFEIGAIDGHLRVSRLGQRRLDREQIDRYRLKIAASDKGEPPLQTIFELVIQVADLNDNRPVFEPRFYSVTINENGAIGTPVLQLNATDKDIDLNGLIRYSIIEGDENRDFSIDERSGQITIAKTIDYERKRRYDLKVRAEDCALPDRETLTTETSRHMMGIGSARNPLTIPKRTNSDVASVTIHVIDCNDNRPEFVHSPYSIRVRENYIPMESGLLLTVAALDRDSDAVNPQIRYALQKNARELSPSHNDAMFRMNATSGQLFLIKPFNRETQSEYWLTVLATDSGTPEQVGTGSIQIIVIDENDESPEFEQSKYSVEIAENNNLDVEVIEVRAFDNDEGPNSLITYRLKENGEQNHKFAIDSQTGILRVVKSLDREEIAEFDLEVVAEDLALDEKKRRSTTAKIHVTVLDENDNRPEFQLTKAKVFVPNTISGDELVYANTATDRDTGNNSRIAYRLIDNQFAKFFQIDAETGTVRTKSNLDSIFRKFYTIELLVEAADCGGGNMVSGSLIKPLRSAYELKIYAKNRSEFPVFSSLLNSHLRVSENATQFEPLTKIAVVDTGASVEYGILGGRAARYFRIDRISGQVVFFDSTGSQKHNCEFDRELMPFSELMITARRPKMPEVMSIFELKLELTDVNDNAPQFDRDSYHFTIPEEEPIALKIGQVKANDRDTPENSRVTYKLLESHENRFSIESETGEILAAPKFDREQQQWYRFEVEASDNGTPEPLRSRVIVTVEVLDRNDNAPHFTQLFSANVTENCLLGTFVVQVSSLDRDVGQNANRIFNFLQNPGDKFVIDPLSGNITVMDMLDREVQDEYILTVRVFDGAWASSTTVTITIQDENDNEPKFEKDHYWFNVLVDEYAENEAHEHEDHQYGDSDVTGGQVIGRVYAFDNDKPGPNSQIRYRLSTEINSHHHDNHVHKRTIISSGVEAADWFTIDSQTGQLRAKRPLRYRNSKRYRNENRFRFEVEASDSGSPPAQFTTSCEVFVNLLPRQHDQQQQSVATLKFEHDRYLVALKNSSRQGDNLVHVRMISTKKLSTLAGMNRDQDVNSDGDEDRLVADDLLFKLNESGNWSKYFQVDERTGLVQLLNDDVFRFRKPGERLTIEIEARDAFQFGFGAAPETISVAAPIAKCSIDVVIVTENREAPVFSANSYQVIIPENEPIGTIILAVSATDGDGLDSPNGLVLYRIVSGNKNNEFALNSTTGLLTINRNLDYERQQHYELNVTAEDCGVNRRTANALIKITLKDLNDNQPKFAHESYWLKLAENSRAGTLVGQIQASDADSGVNSDIRYRWLSGPSSILVVDETSGEVHSNASVDFEKTERLEYELSAWNPSRSSAAAATTVLVHVEIEGRNEFIPQFVRKVFQFEISETAAVGRVVGSVEAFDQDAGRDGQIYFYFQENKGDNLFEIDKRSGQIRVARELDRETRNRVTLTVLAKNHGPIRGHDTDEAQVIIAIEDGNDPPEFESTLYDVRVQENVAPGTRILTVRAHDRDVRAQNNQFVYALIATNKTSASDAVQIQTAAFKIDSRTGQLETSAELDRELREIYELQVLAIDSGEPAKTGHTLVRVHVEDINDNAPYLDVGAGKFYGEVPENEPIGTKIGQLEAHDSDAEPNRGPFKYRLVNDRLDSIYVTVDSQSGWVRTRKVIDRELKEELEIVVEIADNGHPEMVSTNHVKFRVTDRNDMPSQPRDLHITGKFVRDSQWEHKWLEIADLRPNDLDVVGDYSCRLAASQDDEQRKHSFRFAGSHSCRLEMDFGTSTEPKSNSRRLQVSANDGRHANVLSSVLLDYEWLDYDWENLEQKGHLLTVRMVNTTLKWLLAEGLLTLSRGDIAAPISVQSANNATDLLVTFVGDDSAKLLANIKTKLSGITISNYSICSSSLSLSAAKSICENNGNCRQQTKISRDQLEISETNTRIFTGPKIEHSYTCECQPDFHGERCEKSANPCDPNPCTDRQQCVRNAQNPLEFQCVCTNGRDGRLCELERPRLFCRERVRENETQIRSIKEDMGMIGSEWCENGGSCRESPNLKLGFFCLCRAGFRGPRCQFRSDSCRPNPCLNQGQCSNTATSVAPVQLTTAASKFGYRCSCPDGFYGKHCERSNYAFDPLSFMHFDSLDATSNDISIVFSIWASTETKSKTSLLLYNYGRVVSGGRSDFFVLEVTHDGIVSFSFGGSRTAIFTLTLAKFGSVANGNWFRVNLVRNGRLVSLSAAKCSEYGQSCEQCKPSDDRCYVNGVGPTGTLNFDSNPLEIGGLDNVDALLERPDQTHANDFVGCIHSITVNGQQLNLAKPQKSNAIRGSCKKCRSEPVGAFSVLSLTATASVEFALTQKHRRVQLLSGNSGRKTLSLQFRTLSRNGRLLKAFSAQKWSTAVELWDGRLVYHSSYGGKSISLTSKSQDLDNDVDYSDGNWHNLTLQMIDRSDFNLLVDGRQYGDTLDATIVHDFLDPYLATVTIGGISDNDHNKETDEDVTRSKLSLGFSGCIANVTINGQLQSFRPDEGLTRNRFLNVTRVHGSAHVHYGCERSPDVRATISTTDPLNFGIMLIVGFFVILFVAISGSFLMFRFKAFDKNAAVMTSVSAPATSTATTLLSGNNSADSALLHKSSSNDLLLNRANHHYIDPESVPKKYKDRSENGSTPISLGVPPLPPPPLPPLLPLSDHSHHHPYHHVHPYHHHHHFFNHVPSSRPDLIGRDNLVTAPEHVQMIAASSASTVNTNPGNTATTGTTAATDLNSEHYDLENISSIAPSDIGIVYNYKSYYQHQHNNGIGFGLGSSTEAKRRGGILNANGNAGGALNTSSAIRLGTAASLASRQHQVTPLARLSPSSEVSSQQPRILTLHDISGKGGSAVSSGCVSKQLAGTILSTHSGGSKGSGGACSASKGAKSLGGAASSAHINHERSSSLLSTMDAVSSSSDLDNRSDHIQSGGSGGGHRRRNPSSQQRFQRSSHFKKTHPLARPTTDDESGNESFTYSEIEFEDSSSNNRTCVGLNDMSMIKTKNMSSAAVIEKHQSYSGGSVSTLVASDDDTSSSFENYRDNDDYDIDNGSNGLENVYKPDGIREKAAEAANAANGRDSPSIATLGWEYLLNLSPSYGANIKDIAELSERRLAAQQQQQQRLMSGSSSATEKTSPSLTKTTSEEYV